MSNLIPNEIWGVGKEGKDNCKVFLHHVDSFVRSRRFENMTLHSVCQGLKVCFGLTVSD